MMAKFDYDETISDVVELLEEFGYVISISHQAISYNASTSRVTEGSVVSKDFNAVTLPLTEKSANENGLDISTVADKFTISEGKLVYAFPVVNDGSLIPAPEYDVDIDDGFGWKIISVTKISPANKDVLYIFAIIKQ